MTPLKQQISLVPLTISPINGPKISVFGGFYPQNLGAHRSDPQEALP